MNCISSKSVVSGSAAVWLLGIGAAALIGPAHADPTPLPYRPEAPFLPILNLFGSPQRGLILSAEEALTGRPAPITIGNTTFVPSFRKGAQDYGGYTRVSGDLQVIRGDLYLGTEAVGQSLQQLRNNDTLQQQQLQQQGSSIETLRGESATNAETSRTLGTNLNQLGQGLDQVRSDQATQQQQLQQHAEGIQSSNATAVRMDQNMATMSTAVNALTQASTSQAATLQNHAAAIDGLATEVGQSKQAINTLDRNLTRLGAGVSGATALAAALGSIPAESQDSPIACGLGTGGYSSRYALAMGCAVRISSALSLNAGGSYLFGGATDYGSGVLANVAGRFGVVYRFGSSTGNKAMAMGAHQRINEQLQVQLQQAEHRQAEMAEELKSLQRRLNSLETMARRP